jgi:hypothetical protein
MAHVSKSGSIPLLVGIALSAMVAAPTAALATDCTPTYVQLTEDPASKVLVGCCNADGTWKTGTLSQRACLNPNNMCQKGHCDGNPNSTCNGDYTNQNGTCVVQDGLNCRLGECQQQLCTANSDPDLIPLRCDDHNDCKDDDCSGSTYFTPSCTHTNVPNGTGCEFPDTDPCTTGVCTDGTCGSVPANGAFCGTASEGTCTPAFCDANGDCNPQGDPITCSGTLQTCRKWECSWDGQSASCTQVKVDPNNPAENSCDTDPHDCKRQVCGPKGKCNAQAQPAGTSCDSNYTTPLTDCYSGLCDSRKNCENEALGVYGFYDGVPCGPQDSNVCTSQTCQGLTCGVVTCNSNTCVACGINGICGGTPPDNCTCTAQ